MFDGKMLPIKRWEVWYQTPFGIIDSLDLAVSKCLENDLDPNALIAPCPVAIDEAGRYEIIVRH